ncbi:TetR/AcrR family transcriptional regulator [Nocardia cyriacigeorgica]|uniref:TetR/AcrR family transcriptional regulator n=1 Tax=Nocardia cyriacigeorgica TaxID=135487 RepID=UPI003F688064
MTGHNLSGMSTNAPDASRPDTAEGRATRSRARNVTDTSAQSTSRRELAEREIMEQATRLFAAKGFAGTTLQDIASATGLTRPALYHYVANKDELLARLVTEIAEHAQLLHRINERDDLDPAQRLREMAKSIALHQMQAPDRFRLILRSEAELPDALAHTYRNSRRRVLKEFIAVIDDGIRAGQFYPANSRTAALGVIGMLNWIAFWHHPGQDDGPTAAGQLADMAVRTVIDPAADTNGGTGPRRILERLRQNLDSLERAIDAI